jgi:hypothetical protein
MNQKMKEETATVLAKSAPPLTVTGMSVFGIPLDEWVYIATLIYLAIQIFVLLRDKIFSGKNDK